MTEAQFAAIALPVCLTGLVIFLGFIIWDLGKQSKAGRLGMFMLFLVLGLGVLGFILKNVIVEFFILSK